jgi:hypothetical protein
VTSVDIFHERYLLETKEETLSAIRSVASRSLEKNRDLDEVWRDLKRFFGRWAQSVEIGTKINVTISGKPSHYKRDDIFITVKYSGYAGPWSKVIFSIKLDDMSELDNEIEQVTLELVVES